MTGIFAAILLKSASISLDETYLSRRTDDNRPFRRVHSVAKSCLAITSRLWQKTDRPTPRQKPLNPLNRIRTRPKQRFKNEMLPSIPARNR